MFLHQQAGVMYDVSDQPVFDPEAAITHNMCYTSCGPNVLVEQTDLGKAMLTAHTCDGPVVMTLYDISRLALLRYAAAW